MDQNIYPPSPEHVDLKKLEPGIAFKGQVTKVLLSILFFFIIYLLLVAVSVGLVIGCFYAGFYIIAFHPSFLTLMLGLGLMILGIAVFVFLVKFIFAVAKNENPLRIEIREQEQPRLFEFIRKLTKETNTPFPKKIFISGDVNAAVFYNSNFWSMFFPVRKNLEIGYGFVNCVNISEFKAVMAHEFGHFSQRSMKLGIFTYNVNKIIYNMLYDNKGYSGFLEQWGNISGYFALFSAITVSIAQGIQSILKGMYGIINKNYLGLSREMEFHADAVAASVAGGNNLVHALTRVELAASCYNTALENAGEWLNRKKVSKNLYSYQLLVFQEFAKQNNLSINQGLPEVPYHFIQTYSRSRVNFKNQWASHPTLEERKVHVEKLDMNTTPVGERAWIIFDNREDLEFKMTKLLYGRSLEQEGLQEKDDDYFVEWYKEEVILSKLPEIYKGFYDKRFIDTQGWDIEMIAKTPVTTTFDELFTEENRQMQSTIGNDQSDLEIIKGIKEASGKIKSFDFDGKKYSTTDCSKIITELETEIKELQQRQVEIDKKALAYFHQFNPLDKTLIQLYTKYQEFEKSCEEYKTLANKIMLVLQPFYNTKSTLEYIVSTIRRMKENEETQLKEFFGRFIREKHINFDSKGNLLDKMIAFKNKSYEYFSNGKFHNEELTELADITIAVADELNHSKWRLYKQVLEGQLERYTQQ